MSAFRNVEKLYVPYIRDKKPVKEAGIDGFAAKQVNTGVRFR